MNKSDKTRNAYMLKGRLSRQGYDWWWHSFTGYHSESGEPKTFYVEFFLCNPAYAKDNPIIVWNNKELKEKGVRPSYCMVNVGHWGKDKGQLHRFFSIKDVEIQNNPLKIQVADCLLTETYIKGSVKVTEEQAQDQSLMTDSGEMIFDLTVDKQVSYNVGYGANKFFRDLNAFEMFWHAEGMKTQFEGQIILNGNKYIVRKETSYGYADKNWGKDFTSPWVWLSSNNLVSKITGKRLYNSVFEVGGGTPKVFGISLNHKLLGQLYYEGEDFEFNFSKFWTGSKTKFDVQERESQIVWHVEQSTRSAKMEVDVRCNKDEMLWINYEAPNGTKRHNKLWNSGNGYGEVKLYKRAKGDWQLIDHVEAKSVGCEYGEFDTTKEANNQ